MIISRESRKSRKIIHRYRSYVAVRMANASEMMRFRVICEIRVRQKSCVKREYFYNAFSRNGTTQKFFYLQAEYFLTASRMFSDCE